jgi:hypothetical protein
MLTSKKRKRKPLVKASELRQVHFLGYNEDQCLSPAICNYCKKVFSNIDINTGNLWTYILEKHLLQYTDNFPSLSSSINHFLNLMVS